MKIVSDGSIIIMGVSFLWIFFTYWNRARFFGFMFYFSFCFFFFMSFLKNAYHQPRPYMVDNNIESK